MSKIILFIDWNPKPYLFEIGGFKVHIYSLCWIIAFVLGSFIMSKIFKKENQKKALLDPLFLYTFLGAIIGARLGEYLFYDPSAFIERPIEVFLPVQHSPGASSFFGLLQDYEFVGFSGLASHGAVLGVIITSYLFSRKYLHRNVLWLLDRIAVVVPFGGAAVRIGNFFNSEIVGKPSNAPWAVKFHQQSLGYGEITPRHPAQLYEAIGYIILGIMMLYFYHKKNYQKYLGALLGIFLILLFLIRFIVEFYKENQGEEAVAQTINIGLNNGQILSIPFMLIGAYLFISSKNRPN